MFGVRTSRILSRVRMKCRSLVIGAAAFTSAENSDTGAVIGGPLTAAAFDDSRAEPLGFVTDREAAWGWWARLVGRSRSLFGGTK